MYKCDNSKPYCKEKDLRVRRNNGQNQVKYNTIHMIISFITTYLKKNSKFNVAKKKNRHMFYSDVCALCDINYKFDKIKNSKIRSH